MYTRREEEKEQRTREMALMIAQRERDQEEKRISNERLRQEYQKIMEDDALKQREERERKQKLRQQALLEMERLRNKEKENGEQRDIIQDKKGVTRERDMSIVKEREKEEEKEREKNRGREREREKTNGEKDGKLERETEAEQTGRKEWAEEKKGSVLPLRADPTVAVSTVSPLFICLCVVCRLSSALLTLTLIPSP